MPIIKMERKAVIIFSDCTKDKMINSLGFSKNERFELVDSREKLATSQEFESINFGEFGGLLQGSKIPIKKNESELVRYFISGKC